LQNTLNIDILNAHGGLGSIPGPRPSEGRFAKSDRSLARERGSSSLALLERCRTAFPLAYGRRGPPPPSYCEWRIGPSRIAPPGRYWLGVACLRGLKYRMRRRPPVPSMLLASSVISHRRAGPGSYVSLCMGQADLALHCSLTVGDGPLCSVRYVAVTVPANSPFFFYPKFRFRVVSDRGSVPLLKNYSYLRPQIGRDYPLNLSI
jgi:hypothetical protein